MGVLSLDDRWLDANERFCELLGQSREEVLSLTRRDTTHPDDFEAEGDELAKVRRGDVQSVHLEEMFRRRNGTPVWVSVTAGLADAGNADHPELLIAVSDLTARRESQRGLSVQHIVSRVIASSQSPADTVASTLSTVATALRWADAAYWEIDRIEEVLRPVQTWSRGDRPAEEFDATTRRTVFVKGEGVPGRTWALGHPFWESDLAASNAYPRRQAATKDGLHSAFAFPVHTSEKFFGVMEFFAEDVLPPDTTLLNAAEGVGYQLGEFMERSRARVAEHESEVRKASILDTALDCIITSNHLGMITEFNPAAVATFGYSKEEVIGRQMVDLIIPPAHREAHLRGMARYLATGEAHVLGRRIEIDAMRSDGSMFPVELAIVRVPLPGPAFFTAYVRDLTDRKRLEAEQERLLTESEKANRAKSEFLATMSHELRTPLNAIAGYAELLKLGIRGPVNAAQVADLDRINRCQAHLLGIINDILQFAKLEAGQLEMKDELFPFETALSAAEELVKPQADAKRVSLRYERNDEAALVRGDRDRFQQIVLNLLSNALKFTPEGGAVGLRAESSDGRVLVRITDTGIGIRAEQLERIFDPFVQVQSGPTRASDGVGLGLAISRDMARQMGGDISVESEIGKGSVFTLIVAKGA